MLTKTVFVFFYVPKFYNEKWVGTNYKVQLECMVQGQVIVILQIV